MALREKIIMVVDDDEDDHKFFTRALNQADPSVTLLHAENGREALNYLSAQTQNLPEVIFVDINMPVMTGWEFLTKVKKLEDLREIPIIVFSSSSNRRDVEIAYDLGALSYCVKPDDPLQLTQVVQAVASNLDHKLRLDDLRKSHCDCFLFPESSSNYF